MNPAFAAMRSWLGGGLLVALCLVAVSPAAAAECPARPDDSAWPEEQLLRLLEPIYQFQLQKPALPDPKVLNTAYDLARLRTHLLEDGLASPVLRAYALVNNRYARSKPEEILVSEDSLLCLLDPFSSVLLSDGLAHHYVFVERVALAPGVVRLADAWAQDSFLIGSDLPEDMRGRLEKRPSGAVTIVAPIKTFRSFLVGAIVEDNDAFARRVAAIDEVKRDPEDLTGLGLSIASGQEPASFALAIPYLQKAVAQAAGPAKKRAQLELAYLCLMAVLYNTSSRSEADRYGGMLRELLRNGDASFPEMSAERLTRIGQRYLELSRLQDSYRDLVEQSYDYLGLAIERDPGYADAFQTRAEAFFGQGKMDGALSDAREAYRLNTAQIRQVIRTPGADFVDRFYQFGPGISIVGELNGRRWRLLNLLAAIYGAKGMQDDKLAIAQEATRLAPIDPAGWMLVAEAQFALSRIADARQSARHAVELASAGDERAKVTARLAAILGAPN